MNGLHTFGVEGTEQHVVVSSVKVPRRTLAHTPADQVSTPRQRRRPAIRSRCILIPILLNLRLDLSVPLFVMLHSAVCTAGQRQVTRVLRLRCLLLDAVRSDGYLVSGSGRVVVAEDVALQALETWRRDLAKEVEVRLAHRC